MICRQAKYLLPPASAASQSYNLRRRPYSQLLPQDFGHLMDCNFITRIMYKNTYWCYYLTNHSYTDKLSVYRILYICCNHLAVCQVWPLNKYVMLCSWLPHSTMRSFWHSYSAYKVEMHRLVSAVLPIIGIGRLVHWYWLIVISTVDKYKFLYLLLKVNRHESGFRFQ